MTIDDCIAQLISLGYVLDLHGPMLDRPLRYRWEACITRPLPSDSPQTSVNAVGFYPSADPISAITRAMDLCANDFEIKTWSPADYNPTCAPLDDLADRLSNLLTPAPITLSPPKFKLKL